MPLEYKYSVYAYVALADCFHQMSIMVSGEFCPEPYF